MGAWRKGGAGGGRRTCKYNLISDVPPMQQGCFIRNVLRILTGLRNGVQGCQFRRTIINVTWTETPSDFSKEDFLDSNSTIRKWSLEHGVREYTEAPTQYFKHWF